MLSLIARRRIILGLLRCFAGARTGKVTYIRLEDWVAHQERVFVNIWYITHTNRIAWFSQCSWHICRLQCAIASSRNECRMNMFSTEASVWSMNSLIEVLEQISEDLTCLQSTCLWSMRPTYTLINNFFAFFYKHLPHSHKLIPFEDLVSVCHFAWLIRQTSSLK